MTHGWHSCRTCGSCSALAITSVALRLSLVISPCVIRQLPEVGVTAEGSGLGHDGEPIEGTPADAADWHLRLNGGENLHALHRQGA